MKAITSNAQYSDTIYRTMYTAIANFISERGSIVNFADCVLMYSTIYDTISERGSIVNFTDCVLMYSTIYDAISECGSIVNFTDCVFEIYVGFADTESTSCLHIRYSISNGIMANMLTYSVSVTLGM